MDDDVAMNESEEIGDDDNDEGGRFSKPEYQRKFELNCLYAFMRAYPRAVPINSTTAVPKPIGVSINPNNPNWFEPKDPRKFEPKDAEGGIEEQARREVSTALQKMNNIWNDLDRVRESTPADVKVNMKAQFQDAFSRASNAIKLESSASMPRAYLMSSEDLKIHFLIKPVFIFAPDITSPHFVTSVTCWKCASSSNVVPHQWISRGGRRVHSSFGGYYLYGRVHRCRNCNIYFNNYDSRVMKYYPRSVQLSLPCYVTWRSAMDYDLVAFIVLLVLHGSSFSGIQRTITARYRDKFCENWLAYLVTIHDINAAKRASSNPLLTSHQPLQVIDFGSYESEWGNFIISAEYVKLMFIEDSQRVDGWLSAQLNAALVTGDLLVMDHTFKIAKVLVNSSGKRPFSALFGVMNNHRQYVGVFVKSTKMESVRAFLEFVCAQMEEKGGRFKYVSTDLCCNARHVIMSIMNDSIKGIHLGGWHALMRICSAVPNRKHPNIPAFFRAVFTAGMDFDGKHLSELASTLQTMATKRGTNLSDEDALKEARLEARGSCFHYYPEKLIIFSRIILDALIPFSKIEDSTYGAPIDLGTWRAFFCLSTHILGLRKGSVPEGCLSDPPELMRDGALYNVVREGNVQLGTKQKLKSLRDSVLEGFHNLINNSWIRATRMNVQLGHALLMRCCVEANRRAAVDAGLPGAEVDYKTPNTFNFESILAMYKALGEEARPSALNNYIIQQRVPNARFFAAYDDVTPAANTKTTTRRTDDEDVVAIRAHLPPLNQLNEEGSALADLAKDIVEVPDTAIGDNEPDSALGAMLAQLSFNSNDETTTQRSSTEPCSSPRDDHGADSENTDADRGVFDNVIHDEQAGGGASRIYKEIWPYLRKVKFASEKDRQYAYEMLTMCINKLDGNKPPLQRARVDVGVIVNNSTDVAAPAPAPVDGPSTVAMNEAEDEDLIEEPLSGSRLATSRTVIAPYSNVAASVPLRISDHEGNRTLFHEFYAELQGQPNWANQMLERWKLRYQEYQRTSAPCPFTMVGKVQLLAYQTDYGRYLSQHQNSHTILGPAHTSQVAQAISPVSPQQQQQLSVVSSLGSAAIQQQQQQPQRPEFFSRLTSTSASERASGQHEFLPPPTLHDPAQIRGRGAPLGTAPICPCGRLRKGHFRRCPHNNDPAIRLAFLNNPENKNLENFDKY
mmetsp:Transcript_2056/g.2708  ORF Transcript_2056/g.2708 Transcript_2056/m.2708 type:complete len:1186 (+) Transcript_2056:76-3633(+)